MSKTLQTGQPGQAEVDSSSIQPGSVVEVMSLENRLIFVGKVEKVQGDAVCIRDANDDTLPMVLVNKELKLRFYREDGNIVLRGKVCGSTMRMWKVDRLESTFIKEGRAFFRQSISTEIMAECGKCPGRGRWPKEMFPCQVLDVSAGGMLISCAESCAEGDLLLVANVRLLEEEPAFSFNCVVRRGGEWKKGVARYGCQFESLSPKDQDRLLRAIFTIQREEIKKRKNR